MSEKQTMTADEFDALASDFEKSMQNCKAIIKGLKESIFKESN